MNYKKHWNGEEGLTSIYTKETAGCQQLEIDVLKLDAGQVFEGIETEKECGLTLLSGHCILSGDGFDFGKIGERMSVFEGKAYAAYIPANRNFTVNAVTPVEIVIAKCPAPADFEPVLITPNDVIVKHLGKPGFQREAHFLIDERLQAGRIYIGENFIQGGQWSSYPGHKHDTENMPEEGFAEEIYFYKYNKPQGFGIQKVYNDDKSIDETYTTYENDFVEMPEGYHPCTTAPGYNSYLLWMMSCDHRGFYMSMDSDHVWMVQ